MKTNRGFTLIEVIVYLALFSVLMAGAVMSLYAVTRGADERRRAAAVASEADFLAAKLAVQVAEVRSLTGVVFDPVARTITLNGVPLTSANVSVGAFTADRVEDSRGSVVAYEVRFVMNGEEFSERLYLP